MEQPYKIAIAGMGGVGGFYGGMLAKTYEHSGEVSVNFVARGAHMQAIQKNGLLLERDAGNIVAHPHQITDRPETLGPLNLIVFCCKAYHLRELALSFAANITADTVLLPLLNGVNTTETLQALYPQAKVLYGCTYIVSKIIADGVVKVTGDLNQLLFGNPAMDRSELDAIAAIFAASGVNVSVQDDIKSKLWEKFSFISPMATATSALNSSIDLILADAASNALLEQLMQEIVALAQREQVQLPDDILLINKSKMAKLPAGATTSMHNDFKNGKNTELETLTGFVVQCAQQHQLEVPAYASQYARLQDKTVQ